jgi:hypothetical protein
MENQIFGRLKEYLDQHRDHMDERMDRVENMLTEFMQQGNSNSNSIGRIEEKQISCNKEWDRNSEQHREFYERLKLVEQENDRIAGGLSIGKIIIIPLCITVIGIILRLVFM